MKPFVFCHKDNFNYLKLDQECIQYDCVSTESYAFFELLEKLDQASFGGQGMGMPRWTFYDCAAMPGTVFGYCLERDQVDSKLLDKFGFNINDCEYIPISMFVAIPKLGVDTWFAHNLCSLGNYFGIKGLGLKTKFDGLNIMQAKTFYGATQWGSSALHIHTQIADLELVSSFTPNHTYPHTLTYRCQFSGRELATEKRMASSYEGLICADDKKQQEQLQAEIENGLKIKLNGRPFLKDEKWVYPYSIYK